MLHIFIMRRRPSDRNQFCTPIPYILYFLLVVSVKQYVGVSVCQTS